jgi:hypothetical protein
MLPVDLLSAEAMVLAAVETALRDQPQGRWEVNLKFEGLKLMPVANRLVKSLQQKGMPTLLVWPDVGACALAKNSNPDIADQIFSINDLIEKQSEEDDDRILLIVAPEPSDYLQFESLSNMHSGPIVMLNGRLESTTIGIGSVARERRRGFLSLWRKAYWLQPLEAGALMRIHPGEWCLFRADNDGYRQVATYEQRPDAETIDAALLMALPSQRELGS